MAIQITCINKDNGNHENPHVAISKLGWINKATGKSGSSTRLEMYNFLAQDDGIAYVVDSRDGSHINLEPRISVNKTKYVRTIPNDTGRDNLLALSECR